MDNVNNNKTSPLTGMVSNIQRCSIHDGPGIRTTIFLKGCNMKCAWCHNPETISFDPQFILYPNKCIGCGMCSDGCFSGARVLCGEQKTVEEVFAEVLEDAPYYGDKGGVTISGGEPTCQHDFTKSLLELCKKHSIHTAVETNLSLSFDKIIDILKLCDLIMCDLKSINDESHIKYTGITNKTILENINLLDTLGIPFIVRTPIIPTINDNPQEVSNIGEFLGKMDNILYYEMLSYHPLGVSKSNIEGGQEMQVFTKPSKASMNNLASLLSDTGLTILVDGEKINF